jgi:AsmA protein
MKKYLLLGVLIVALGLSTLVVLARVLITPERVRQTVVPLVESTVHRSLELGSIDIGLLSGITLDHVVLFEADGKTEFVGVDQVVLRYRLLPLLLLRVEIDEIRLEHPRLRIERNPAGVFNFADLVAEPTPGAAPVATQTETGSVPPLDLRVARFTLNDGALYYNDQQSTPPKSHTVSALNVTVRNFSLRESFPVEVVADWNGNDLKLSGNFDLDDLTTKAVLEFNRLQVRIEGDLLHEAKGERLRARLQVPRITLADLLDSIPANSLPLPDKFAPSGRLQLSIQFDGLLAEPLALIKEANLDLEGVSGRVGELHPVVNGRLHLAGRQLSTEGLSVALGGEKLLLTVQSADLLAQPLAVDLALSADRFNVDQAVPTAVQQPEAPVSGAASAEPVEIGPFSLPLQGTVTVRIGELLVKEMLLQPFELRASLRDNVARIDSLQATLAGGQIQAAAQIDLRTAGLQYTGSSRFDALPINPLVRAFQPSLAKSLYGIVAGRIELSGKGTLSETLKKSLLATGDLQLADGQLKDLPVLDAVAGQLQLEPLRELNFNVGHARFVLRDEVAQLDLSVSGSKVRSAVTGTFGLDHSLDLQAGLGLSPALASRLDRKGGLTRLLSDADGWTTVPLKIRGSAQTPKVSVDTAKLSKQAAGKALDRLSDMVQNKLDKKPAETETGEADPSSQRINDALKGLLGR